MYKFILFLLIPFKIMTIKPDFFDFFFLFFADVAKLICALLATNIKIINLKLTELGTINILLVRSISIYIKIKG